MNTHTMALIDGNNFYVSCEMVFNASAGLYSLVFGGWFQLLQGHKKFDRQASKR